MKSLYWSIDRLPGLQQSEIELLQKHNLTDTKQLLERANCPKTKEDLAVELKLNLKYIMKWTALSDLARVPSVGCQYCGLILHSGIVSVARLARTPFPRLHLQITRLQVATLRRRGNLPSIAVVKQWVEEARSLDCHEDSKNRDRQINLKS